MRRIDSRTASSIKLESHSGRGLALGEAALQKVASRPLGRQFLGDLESLSKKGRVSVFVGAEGTTMANSSWPTAPRNATKKLRGLLKGSGSDAIIEWNPTKSLVLDPNGVPVGREENPDKAFLSLAHELVHAYRIVKGTYTGTGEGGGFDPTVPKGKEELRAVGLGKWTGKRYSENSFRREHGEPLRTAYPLAKAEERLESFDETRRHQGE